MRVSESTRRFLINWAVMFALIATILMLSGVSLFSWFGEKTVLALFAAWWYASQNPGKVLFRADQRIEQILANLNVSVETPHTKPAPASATHDIAEHPSAIAERALRRAGLNPDDLPVQLSDIGLLVYRGGKRADSIARDEAIATDATHVRPFIRVNFPLKQNGGDTIRFQLIDDKGKIRYNDENWYDLTPGDNYLVTKTWLPISTLNGEAPDGGWKLRVVVGETPFAVHLFRWQQSRRHEVRSRLTSDGEIDERWQAPTDKGNPLSLDELLSDQPPAARTTARRQ